MMLTKKPILHLTFVKSFDNLRQVVKLISNMPARIKYNQCINEVYGADSRYYKGEILLKKRPFYVILR